MNIDVDGHALSALIPAGAPAPAEGEATGLAFAPDALHPMGEA